MKGIVLAGGLGSRLFPLTRITNKHLLPVFDQPMIYYPIRCLVEAGIHDILVVTGGSSAGDFLKLLRNGAEFGLSRIHYAYQEGEGGIAAALSLAEDFADREPICVVLGDNILENSITGFVKKFRHQGSGAKILLSQVPDPHRFGVPVIEDGRILRIEEKPADPKSPYAVIGVYMYDNRVFDIIKTLKPSGRGELEITDVNNQYIEWGDLSWDIIEGWWTDAGTFDSLLQLVYQAFGKRLLRVDVARQQHGTTRRGPRQLALHNRHRRDRKDDADARFGQTNFVIARRCNTVIAAELNDHAAGNGMAVDRGDHRQRQAIQSPDHAVQLHSQQSLLSGAVGGHGFQVEPCGKEPARAGD